METKNFTFAGDPKMSCTCCNTGQLAIGLLILLEELKTHYNGAPVTLTSGARCRKYNTLIGSNNRSQHAVTHDDQIAEAVDVQVSGVTPRQLYTHMCQLPYANLLGLGLYQGKGFVHIDIRGYGARWKG
jgi:uncharacterized protein YcbK (DUF882 family)